MTIADLLEILSDYDPQDRVVFKVNSWDQRYGCNIHSLDIEGINQYKVKDHRYVSIDFGDIEI